MVQSMSVSFKTQFWLYLIQTTFWESVLFSTWP